MRTNKTAPEVNAGSMADIAFLLLIFFLVTTTLSSDIGINRKLPRLCPPGQTCDIDIHERNILRVQLNNKGEIMVNDELVILQQLKDKVKQFIDNNGDNTCEYCYGNKDKSLSDNPSKAVISLQSSPHTSYELFIEVQDELTKAYYELRKKYASSRFNKPLDKLSRNDIALIKKAYPFIISEALTK